jgi:hypothetical protein
MSGGASVSKGGWFASLKRRLDGQRHVFDRSGAAGRAFAPSRASMLLIASLSLFALIVGTAMWLGPNYAQGDEAGAASGPLVPEGGIAEPSAAAPTAQQTKEALESPNSLTLEEAAQTDPRVAAELPHRDLDGEEALELVEGVFGARLEESSGIYDELEPEKFLSDNAAVISASDLPGSPGAGAGAAPTYEPEPQGGIAPGQSVLVESTLPLRTENAEGKEEAVDLSLESPEGSGGELQPQNPLAEVAIPAHIGEGISVGEVQFTVAGAAQERAPTNVEEQYAVYPNISENTDLVVTPTPTGLETMADIRSAEASTTTTYELSLPAGAELKASQIGGAEVVQDGRAVLVVPPPTATDAAGNPVPVELQVEGDRLRTLASPGPETSYPILVDPAFIVESWSWTSNHETPSSASWTPGTTQWAYCPLNYSLWDPAHYPGLDLSSGLCEGSAPVRPVRTPTGPTWFPATRKTSPDTAPRRPPGSTNSPPAGSSSCRGGTRRTTRPW